MSVTDYLRLRYLTHFSKPTGERLLYRTIHQHKVRTILELGIGSAERAARMIEVAATQNSVQEIQYTGVDLFEARSGGTSGMTLKMAYRQLQATGARVRLLPGDPLLALSQAANGLRGIDLLVVSAGQDSDSLARAWFYVPRMLHPLSQVLMADPSDGEQFRCVSTAEIETRAVAALRRRVA